MVRTRVMAVRELRSRPACFEQPQGSEIMPASAGYDFTGALGPQDHSSPDFSATKKSNR